MSSLLEHDHEELGAIVRDLFTALDVSDAEESFRRLDLLWARLAVHIRAEHLHLFPAILLELKSGRKPRGGNDEPSLDEARQAIAQLRGLRAMTVPPVGVLYSNKVGLLTLVLKDALKSGIISFVFTSPVSTSGRVG